MLRGFRRVALGSLLVLTAMSLTGCLGALRPVLTVQPSVEGCWEGTFVFFDDQDEETYTYIFRLVLAETRGGGITGSACWWQVYDSTGLIDAPNRYGLVIGDSHNGEIELGIWLDDYHMPLLVSAVIGATDASGDAWLLFEGEWSMERTACDCSDWIN